MNDVAMLEVDENVRPSDRLLEREVDQLSGEIEQLSQLHDKGLLAPSSRLEELSLEMAEAERQLANMRDDPAAAAGATQRVAEITEKKQERRQKLLEQGLVAEDGVAAKPLPQIANRAAAATLGGPLGQNVVGAVSPAPEAEALKGSVIKEERDRFEDFEPSRVKSVAEQPVSTFSIDVDTASYSFLRGALNAGRIPPKDALRVEELINYFPYAYEGPESAETPFKANIVVTPTPWNAGTKLMHIGIKGYSPPVAKRPRANLVFLIDTSGSMNEPNKLPLLVNSFRLLLGALDDDDTVSIVVYAGSAGAVLEPTKASERTKIEAALTALRAGGSTAGAEGLKLAYQKARESFDAEAVNRVILATDGDFNVGFSSPEEMKDFVERERDSGVFLSVLGFGRGNYNDALMQALAQNGNGVAAYIDTLSEARKVLADEAGGALIPIAKDVKIQVEFN
ncbi:MAG: VWA domain-containing protein, partial [Rhodobacteraceae bacterium]|nr:VWA domain-containing protein [Paracoccaceae bacterium]